jgi:hypothetical protein
MIATADATPKQLAGFDQVDHASPPSGAQTIYSLIIGQRVTAGLLD